MEIDVSITDSAVNICMKSTSTDAVHWENPYSQNCKIKKKPDAYWQPCDESEAARAQKGVEEVVFTDGTMNVLYPNTEWKR